MVLPREVLRPSVGGAQVLVVFSEEDEGSRLISANVKTTLAMSRVAADFVEVTALTPAMLQVPGPLVVVATEQWTRLPDPASVLDFVRRGGRVVFLMRAYFNSFNEMTGILEQRGFVTEDRAGVRVLGPLFPGKDGLTYSAMTHSMLEVRLSSEAKVLAETLTGQPLVWTHRFGAGEVLYVNSTMMKSKIMRGLMLQCIAYLPDYFLSTIFNGLVFNIDDFPAPIRFGRVESIYQEYFMETPRFFRDIWWPDTYSFARRHNLALTGLAISTFNEATTSPLPPINPLEWAQLVYFGRRLSEVGGELGIHGYNHQSLTLVGQMDFASFGYTPWPSQEAMAEGLRILRDGIIEKFGDVRIFSYVPPSNIVSREGRLAVAQVFPDVRVFAGVYAGDGELGLLEQEFGRDPYVPHVVSFPRLSSGYLHNDDVLWAIYNGIAHFGLVHHFIHPDDLLDPIRSGGHTWEQMDRQINAMFREIRRRFPSLRAMTLVQAHRYFIQSEGLEVSSYQLGDVIKVQHNRVGVPFYHLLRLRSGTVEAVVGGEFYLVCRINRIYVIRAQHELVEIKLQRR